MGNLQQTIDQNRFRRAVYDILKKNEIGSGDTLPSDQELLDNLCKLGRSHSVVNAVLKNGQGIRIDKYDNGKSYKISSNGNGEFGADITNQSLGINISKSDPTNQVIKKVIEAVDTAKNTAIKAEVIHGGKMVKANQTGEIPWQKGDKHGVLTGLTPSGWYLSLNLESQTEPMLVDLVPMLGEVYRSAVLAARNDMQVYVNKVMEQHLKQYHVGIPKTELPEIPDPFNPPVTPPVVTPKPESGESCGTPDDFAKSLEDIFKKK